MGWGTYTRGWYGKQNFNKYRSVIAVTMVSWVSLSNTLPFVEFGYCLLFSWLLLILPGSSLEDPLWLEVDQGAITKVIDFLESYNCDSTTLIDKKRDYTKSADCDEDKITKMGNGRAARITLSESGSKVYKYVNSSSTEHFSDVSLSTVEGDTD